MRKKKSYILIPSFSLIIEEFHSPLPSSHPFIYFSNDGQEDKGNKSRVLY
jgi:hypothetical protein